jgi:hypothetical protein
MVCCHPKTHDEGRNHGPGHEEGAEDPSDRASGNPWPGASRHGRHRAEHRMPFNGSTDEHPEIVHVSISSPMSRRNEDIARDTSALTALAEHPSSSPVAYSDRSS